MDLTPAYVAIGTEYLLPQTAIAERLGIRQNKVSRIVQRLSNDGTQELVNLAFEEFYGNFNGVNAAEVEEELDLSLAGALRIPLESLVKVEYEVKEWKCDHLLAA